ncbi:heme-binding domain-containing protein [Pelodictyon luteolum]|uniref:Haem-binding domain-containing protein n=1 Tax=Chlorobium luteolum (strain DSM 273 / BCRC 81028 / 2530) TaxID=319225 RepID=Q3B5Y5_CHLL3|nr:heme-binding domain-containing protein [Pelodictyon luteolum]ABB23246.1 conserved hypothetical protein [Pelodictyon luteolum DSM 273]
MRPTLRSAAGWAVLALMLMQFIPLGRLNPEPHLSIKAPAPILQALGKACYDCHSYRTRWPRAAYVAPASWLIVHSVRSGREALNFSDWNRSLMQQSDSLRNTMMKVVMKGSRHQPMYYILNPESRLTAREEGALVTWLKATAIQH